MFFQELNFVEWSVCFRRNEFFCFDCGLKSKLLLFSHFVFIRDFFLFDLVFVSIDAELRGEVEGITRDSVRVKFLFGGVSPLDFMSQTCSGFFIFFLNCSLFGLLFRSHKRRFFLCVVLSIKFFVVIFDGSDGGDSFSVDWVRFFLCFLVTFGLGLSSDLIL